MLRRAVSPVMEDLFFLAVALLSLAGFGIGAVLLERLRKGAS